MSDSNRRSFLIAAGATVAGAAVVVQATRAEAAEDLSGAPQGDVLAHVHDVRAGTITVMVRGEEVRVTDPALAARIAAAMKNVTA